MELPAEISFNFFAKSCEDSVIVYIAIQDTAQTPKATFQRCISTKQNVQIRVVKPAPLVGTRL